MLYGFGKTDLRRVKRYMVFGKTDSQQAQRKYGFVKTDLRQVRCYMDFVKLAASRMLYDFRGKQTCDKSNVIWFPAIQAKLSWKKSNVIRFREN